jgi:arsenite methyltransferase
MGNKNKIETSIAFECHDNAKDYYGKQLESNKNLKTTACCSLDDIPAFHRKLLANIDDEILNKFYGCGSPLPPAVKGLKILDIGCGTGRDVYMLSQLVGDNGFVTGIDMTDEQLDVARKHIAGQMKRFGYKNPNVEFCKGLIEDLASAGIEDSSIDLVVSNCVINLSPRKADVFRGIFRVLKPGGEFYFSDVYASRRVTDELRKDPLLHGECLSGALYTEDFRRILLDLGCPDYRTISSREISITDAEVKKKIGNIRFFSKTMRAFKLDSLEDKCEDYGQTARYLGNMEESANSFRLDDHHLFETGKPYLVCGNTAAMLQDTRFSDYFEITGNRAIHYGLFDCKDLSQGTLYSKNDGSCC